MGRPNMGRPTDCARRLTWVGSLQIIPGILVITLERKTFAYELKQFDISTVNLRTLTLYLIQRHHRHFLSVDISIISIASTRYKNSHKIRNDVHNSTVNSYLHQRCPVTSILFRIISQS
jgi:hypothetical protein